MSAQRSRPPARARVRPAWLVVLSAALGYWAVGCASTAPLPPVSDAAGAQHLPGKFVWFGLITHDPATAQTFYRDLLGWRFESVPGDKKAWVIRSGDRPVGAMVEVKPAQAGEPIAQWVSFLSVPDIEAAAELCRERGRLYRGPVTVPGLGRIAVAADPLGAPLGLIYSESGDPPDGRAPRAHEWLWVDYLASSVDSARAFYADLIGFETREVASRYWVFTKGGVERAGMVRTPSPEVSSNWLPYVLVSDAAQAAGTAERLGGRVILAPREEIRAGSTAIVSDPTGAALALQRYPY